MPIKIALKVARMIREKPNQWNDESVGGRWGDSKGLSSKMVMSMYIHDKAMLELYTVTGQVHDTLYMELCHPAVNNMGRSVMLDRTTTIGMTVKLTCIDEIIIYRAIRWWKNWAFVAVPVLTKMREEGVPTVPETGEQQTAPLDVGW